MAKAMLRFPQIMLRSELSSFTLGVAVPGLAPRSGLEVLRLRVRLSRQADGPYRRGLSSFHYALRWLVPRRNAPPIKRGGDDAGNLFEAISNDSVLTNCLEPW